jgi:aspartate racemase
VDRQVKTLGIIGGTAPPSTIDYYRLITTRYRERSPEGSYPSVLIDSVDGTSFLRLVAAGDEAPIVDFLLVELDRLARAGASIALFASNTPHLVFEAVEARSPVPLISIVEETALVAAARGFAKVGLIGTRFTMERGFYQRVFGRHGISVVIPTEADRAYVHDHYLSELVEGVFLDATRDAIGVIIERLHRQEGAEAVVLGGTELPLLLRDAVSTPVPLLDTTIIHVESAIERLLG